EMEGLRVELGGEGLDGGRVDPKRSRDMLLPRDEVFEVGHDYSLPAPLSAGQWMAIAIQRSRCLLGGADSDALPARRTTALAVSRDPTDPGHSHRLRVSSSSNPPVIRRDRGCMDPGTSREM